MYIKVRVWFQSKIYYIGFLKVIIDSYEVKKNHSKMVWNLLKISNKAQEHLL
jgi:hypothetical protein